jgi:hypothetical protein
MFTAAAERVRENPRSKEPQDVPQPKLRIFYGDDESAPDTASPPEAPAATVTVALSEVFPLLAEAAGNRRSWLSDFADDPITISEDLYEISVAYQHYRRPLSPKLA